MKKFNIEDYSDQLQQLCGVSKHCNRCMKRGKNVATNYCIIKRFAFEVSKTKHKQILEHESED